MKILELMQLPPDDHDLAWLQQALQATVELEMATIPPYLCAMWSVKDPDSPVFSTGLRFVSATYRLRPPRRAS